MLNTTQINQVINLNTEEITELLQKTYPEDEVSSAAFVGLNSSGQFVFAATWYNPEDEIDENTWIYVRERDGELFADY